MLFGAQIVPPLVIKLALCPSDRTLLIFHQFRAFWPNKMSQAHLLLSLSLPQGVLVPVTGQWHLETENWV